MLQNETTTSLSGFTANSLVTVPEYIPGTNELLVMVNKSINYPEIQYLEVDSTHIRILFDPSPGDILTVGILSGYSYGPAGWLDKTRPVPTLKYAGNYPGSISLGLPVVSTDSRVTHIQVHRNRSGVLTLVDTVPNGTATYLVPDARIGDEYYLRTLGTDGLVGPASRLVRVRALVSLSPKAA